MDTRESVSVLDRKNPFRANLVLNIKIVSLGRERRSPSFLTFNVIISHIFPEDCIEISGIVQKI